MPPASLRPVDRLGWSWVVRKHALLLARPTLELCLHAADPPFPPLRLEHPRDAIAPPVTVTEISEHGRLAPGRWWLRFVHIKTVEPPSRDCIARSCWCRQVVIRERDAGLYRKWLRRPILTWGATEAEATARLPGDELLENADGVSTRAIDIVAPGSAVWPWLAQIGPSPRGGAYTYDWIENLSGLNMHSADTVLPQFQHPAVGVKIALGSNRMRLERVEPDHVLAWRSEDGYWVWSFVMTENEGTTRLISRNRFRLPTLVARIGMAPMEAGSLVMKRKMLRGIKQRAERLVGSPAA